MKTTTSHWLLPLALSFSLAHAAPDDNWEVFSKEASRIDNEMHLVIPNIAERDPELQKLAEKSAAAGSALQQALETHPALNDIRIQRDAAQAKLSVILTKDDTEDKRSAQEAYSAAKSELTLKGRELPEIKSLMDAANDASAAYQKRKEAAYAAQPETAAMAKKVAELRAKVDEMRGTTAEK